MTRQRHQRAAWRWGAVLAAGLALVTSCSSNQVPETVLDVVRSCGTVLYSGYAGAPVARVAAPTSQDSVNAPPAGTSLPLTSSAQPISTNIVVFRFTSDCEHGDQVTVVPLSGVDSSAVAHSKDGGIAGLTLELIPLGNGSPQVTVYDYRHGRLVGVAHLTR